MEHSSMVDVGNMKTFKLFPTIITGFELDIPINEKIQMIKYIQNYEGVKSKQGMRRTLNQTEDDLHCMSYFKYLKEQIIKMNEKVIDDLGYEYEGLIITSMWGNNIASGGIHTPHTHSNNFLSGVFYLKTDTASAQILFYDPRPQANVIVPRRKENIWENSNVVMFTPTENTGIIFPSWLQHFVPTSNGERISISWNILIKGHYGEPNSLQNAYI